MFGKAAVIYILNPNGKGYCSQSCAIARIFLLSLNSVRRRFGFCDSKSMRRERATELCSMGGQNIKITTKLQNCKRSLGKKLNQLSLFFQNDHHIHLLIRPTLASFSFFSINFTEFGPTGDFRWISTLVIGDKYKKVKHQSTAQQ